jgi:hypothetical protein
MPETFTPYVARLPAAQRQLWPDLRPLAQQGMVLHGGTAIALRLGHRESVDFDYFTHLPLNRAALLAAFPRFASATIIQDEPNSLTGIIPGSGGEVKISFFGTIHFGRVGEPQTTDDGVAVVASLWDLLAQKLKTVMQRIEAKDYQDVAALLRAGVPLDAGMAGAMALYSGQFSPLECARALVYFKDRALALLSSADRMVLLDAVRELLTISRSLRPAAILSSSLA